MIKFHKSIIKEFLNVDSNGESMHQPSSSSSENNNSDGLLIIAAGLGYRNVLLSMIKIHANKNNLCLFINSPVDEFNSLKLDFINSTCNHEDTLFFKHIDSSLLAEKRAEMYLAGGVIAVTSRILVVDMLNKVIPLHLVAGIFVNHAHRISSSSLEAFILRIYRTENKAGFIKAFSSHPEAFKMGIWKLEKTMKLLFLRRVFLWPRFHVAVQDDLKSVKINLIEIKIPLTKLMKTIQQGLIDCIQDCLMELKRANPRLELDEFSLENAFFRSFDWTVKAHLDPVWHRISKKTKSLISDLKTLRKLLSYLLSYDCVSFYSFLEAVRASNANAQSKSLLSSSADTESPWLLNDSTDSIFKAAKARVFHKKKNDLDFYKGFKRNGRFHGVPEKAHVILEEQPKWRVLRDILAEIEGENLLEKKSGKKSSFGPTLIMVEDERTAKQLKKIMSGLDFTVIKEEEIEDDQDVQEESPSQTIKQIKVNIGDNRRRKRGGSNAAASTSARPPPSTIPATQTKKMSTAFYTAGSESLMRDSIRKFFWWRSNLAKISKTFKPKQLTTSRDQQTNQQASSSSSTTSNINSNANSGDGSGRGGQPSQKRRRVKGGAASEAANAKETMWEFKDDFEEDPIRNSTIETDEDDNVELLLDTFHAEQDEQPVAPMDSSQVMLTQAADLEEDSTFQVIDPNDIIQIKTYASSSMSIAGSSNSSGDEDSRLLEDLNPSRVIMYDSDVSFIRRLEVYKASHQNNELKVFFMVYDNSVEEQRYLTKIRKEKEAFEKLIKEKSMMAIALDADGRINLDPDDMFWNQQTDSRFAGGQRQIGAPSKVIVDVREFRSHLPYALFSQRFNIRPVTLEVGDYILSPNLCVERKSIEDLIGSFRSGRIFTQCEAMSSHYAKPILLIEFDPKKCFSLVGSNYFVVGQKGLSMNKKEVVNFELQSKIVLLTMNFPKLRIIWSKEPDATAEIFLDLKEDEPDAETSMKIGVENTGGTLNCEFNPTPQEVLRTLPGITSRNYRLVMQSVDTLRKLSDMSLADLQKLIGDEDGSKLFNFFIKKDL